MTSKNEMKLNINESDIFEIILSIIEMIDRFSMKLSISRVFRIFFVKNYI